MPRYSLQHPITKWRTTRRPALTSAQVAQRAGIDATSLCKVETRKRDRLGPDSCLRLVAAFPGELELRDLLEFEWPKVRPRRRPAS